MQTEATQLMTAARGGDVAAFETLSQRVRARAFQVAHSLVGSREDALDLCQEAFLKAFRARQSYDPSQPFMPWFHRILRNTCFSFLRKHRRLRKRSLTYQGEDGEDEDYELTDPGPAPDAGVLAEERSLLFQGALDGLSARDREILVLRHFEELSYRDIAATLGVPQGTVMSRLFHARRRLRDALQPLLDDASRDSTANPAANPKGKERVR